MKKIVFPYVEAGMGHIMPLKAVAEVFKKKYGDKVEVVETYFFRDQKNVKVIKVEEDFVRQVKMHNRRKGWGAAQFFLLNFFGQRISLNYLYRNRYKYAYESSLEYFKVLDADLIFNTHFATLYYSTEAKQKGLINSKIVSYCPDPVIGNQWDNRFDTMFVSSKNGIKIANKSRSFKNTNVLYSPFTINPKVLEYKKTKEEYKKELGIDPNEFTILMCDGAYGAGKLEKNLTALLKLKEEFTVIVVTGKNEELLERLKNIKVPKNIKMLLYGFTDKMLLLNAASDIFVGKSGASNLAEASYFGLPVIVTSQATKIEVWIADYYINEVGNGQLIKNTKKVISTLQKYINNPKLIEPYIKASKKARVVDGPEVIADYLWESLQ